MPEPVRTLVVDDSPLARKAIRTVLEEAPDFLVVGEAGSGEEALGLAGELAPDLVLMDVRMPGIGGIEATRRLRALSPASVVVILSVSSDVTDLFQAIRNGAQGYLLKNLDPSHWVEYLRQVVSTGTPISREIASLIVAEFASSNPVPSPDLPPAAEEALPRLSEREMEVLRLTAAGLQNEEIARRLHLSPATVKNHLRNILAKLHLRNRTQLASYAYRRGLLRPHRPGAGPPGARAPGL
ncbi:MAG: response regulator transcription factor [Bacillota bacterium]|nr:response regulator transcription factor [Bacillota bacterium]